MSEVVEVGEELLDLSGEVLTLTENIVRNQRNARIFLVGAAVVGLAVGAAVTWKLTEKKLGQKYDAILDEEIVKMRAFFEQTRDKPPLADLAARYVEGTAPAVDTTSVIEAAQALGDYQGKIPYDRISKEAREEAAGPPVVNVTNVFVEGKPMEPDDFDYEAEVANRTEDNPYVITYDEFTQNEPEYDQNTVTWYEGDDTLADDKDVPIPDAEKIIGDETNIRFGHGSRDPRIVYIRNEAMQTDFEVVQHTGSFAQAVLGFRHSDRPGSRKTPRYRGDDG